MMKRTFQAALAACVLTCACGDDGEVKADNDTGKDEPDAQQEDCTKEMYGKYKQAGFEAVNAKILENIGKVSAMNPSPIGDSFKGLSEDDVARVEANLLDFLVMVYGGPSDYQGKSMKAAHKGLGITQDEYDAFVSMVVVPALSDVGVSSDDITMCFAPPVTDPAFVADIVEK